MPEYPTIMEVSNEIAGLCSPVSIFVISHKVNFNGDLTGFKLCLIIPDDGENSLIIQQQLYMEVDSDVPFDLVIYRQSEWDELKSDVGSFAWKISLTGRKIYG